MNKEKFTRAGLEPAIDVPGLYQLSYLALHWRSPYFVNIFVRGRQSEVMKPYTALSFKFVQVSLILRNYFI